MSYTNPNVSEILACTTGIIGKHFAKSYLNLAKGKFRFRHKRNATRDDAQELRDIFEADWVDYYVYRPIREKENREKGKPIWEYGCKFKIDVYNSMCRFIEYKYAKDIVKYGYSMKQCCADIMEEKGFKLMETHIIDNDLLDEYKKFIKINRKTLKKHFGSGYSDFSHLAYNGVTDDF
jgi:hypothetical protein